MWWWYILLEELHIFVYTYILEIYNVIIYREIKSLGCANALEKVELLIDYNLVNSHFYERSEEEVNYLIDNLKFTLYRPNIKNFVYTKIDYEDDYEIESVIGNYYYYYYYSYRNSQLTMKKGEVIIIDDYDDLRTFSFNGHSTLYCTMLLPNDKYCYCGIDNNVASLFAYGNRYIVNRIYIHNTYIYNRKWKWYKTSNRRVYC